MLEDRHLADSVNAGQLRRGRPRKATALRAAPWDEQLPAQRIALHEEARDRLRRMIVHGQLSPGSDIGEAGLSEALGMSRTPIREALKLLAVEGLVELRSNRGTIIMPVRTEEVPALFEVAAGIERLGAELAASRATAADLAGLRRLQELMEHQHGSAMLDAYFDLNQKAHRAIIAAARNDVLTAAHEMLFARVERVRLLALNSQPRWDESVREHREVLAALEGRDAARAGQALARHVLHTGERAMELLQAAASPTAGARS